MEYAEEVDIPMDDNELRYRTRERDSVIMFSEGKKR
jgi:hypothetical protein